MSGRVRAMHGPGCHAVQAEGDGSRLRMITLIVVVMMLRTMGMMLKTTVMMLRTIGMMLRTMAMTVICCLSQNPILLKLEFC